VVVIVNLQIQHTGVKCFQQVNVGLDAVDDVGHDYSSG